MFEKKFVGGYELMKVEGNGGDSVYGIGWKEVVLIVENGIVKRLKMR